MDHGQHIGCRVASCKFNENNQACSLHVIMVEPGPGGHTGNPKDESLCASYQTKG